MQMQPFRLLRFRNRIEFGTPPFPLRRPSQNGPRRQGFAAPRRNGAPLTAPELFLLTSFLIEPNVHRSAERLRNFPLKRQTASRSRLVSVRCCHAREATSRQYGPFRRQNRCSANQKCRENFEVSDIWLPRMISTVGDRPRPLPDNIAHSSQQMQLRCQPELRGELAVEVRLAPQALSNRRPFGERSPSIGGAFGVSAFRFPQRRGRLSTVQSPDGSASRSRFIPQMRPTQAGL